MAENTVKFITEDGDEIEFKVLEETKLNGKKYLLVVDDIEGEDEEALILCETGEENGETSYEIVEDDKEMAAVAKIFEEELSDIELITG